MSLYRCEAPKRVAKSFSKDYDQYGTSGSRVTFTNMKGKVITMDTTYHGIVSGTYFQITSTYFYCTSDTMIVGFSGYGGTASVYSFKY